MTPKNERTVLIAGGGASAALVAAHLLKRAPGTRVIVVEPALSVGRGMAYSTTCREHLLNVAAGRMSAFEDDPRHFLRWLAARGYSEFSERSFVPRMIYGEYLESVLNNARENTGFARFTHLRARATGFTDHGGGLALELADGRMVEGDALVLAMGNASPAPWPSLSPDPPETGRYFGSAWVTGATAVSNPDESILLIGTGLTAVDAILALRYNGHRGNIVMVSRRGLLPRVHRLFDCATLPSDAGESALELMRNMRTAARRAQSLHQNWRVAVDGIRRQTNDLWAALPLSEQRRFLRHMRPYWDTHRHRMAPEIGAKLEALADTGALRVIAGRIGRIESSPAGVSVSLTSRGSGATDRLEVGRVINCTGAEASLSKLLNPLIRNMLREGAMVEHPLRSGALVTRDGALIGRDGRVSDRVFTMGPLRIGTLIESVAIPEIREQARQVADLLGARPRRTPEVTPTPVLAGTARR